MSISITPFSNAVYPQREDFVGQRVDHTDGIVFMPNTISESTRNINGNYRTYYYIFGVLQCGRKVAVLCENVPIFATVKVPSSATDSDTFLRWMRTQLRDRSIYCDNMEIIKLFPFKGFSTEPQDWVRVWFPTSKNRYEFLTWCSDGKMEVCDDDMTLFPLIARSLGMPTASWCCAMGANPIHPSKVYVRNIDDVYTANMANIKSHQLDQQDKTLVVSWDIETRSKTITGDAPGPDDDFTIVSIAAVVSFKESKGTLCSFAASLMETMELPKHGKISPRNLIVVCKDEKELMLSWISFLKAIRPDVMQAFNGGGYDWPLVRSKMRKLGLLRMLADALSCIIPYQDTEESVYKYNFKKEKVKVSPEERMFPLTAQFPGMLDTDTMIVFKQEYPTAEVGRGQSLNHYLKINGLDSKEDMYYKRLHRIYEMSTDIVANCTSGNGNNCCTCNNGGNNCEYRSTINAYYTEWVENEQEKFPIHMGSCAQHIGIQAALLIYYNVIDCLRIQQLYEKRTVISDRRAFANRAFMSTYDAFYRANGVKVQNLVGYYCHLHGYAYSNKSVDNTKHKYPGAIVFSPQKGLHNINPTTALDASSLYPSIQRAYNISPDKTITIRDDVNYSPEFIARAKASVDDLKNKGYSFHHIKFQTLSGVDVEAYVVRHNGNHTLNYMNAAIISHYQTDSNGKYNKDKSGRLIPVVGRACLPGECMGIMPFFLDKLFNDRLMIKKKFGPLGELREKFAKLRSLPENANRSPTMYLTNDDFRDTGITLTDTLTYETVDVSYAKLNSDQKAVKLLMNTVYGASGNCNSPLYLLAVAGGITKCGRDTISEVYRYCTELGYTVRYGDTDSNYLGGPRRLFDIVATLYEQHIAHLEKLRDKCGLPPGPHPQAYVKEDRITIGKIYDANNKKYADNIKAKKSTHVDYQSDESAWIDSIRWVEESISESRIEALRSREREDYWTKMVQIKRMDIERLRVDVNDHLTRYNGTEFIAMAYEEVLMPAVLTGKKKYFGFQHMKNENFHPTDKDLFIKGIDIIKQGQTQLAKEYGYSTIRQILSVDNYDDILTIIKAKLRDLVSRKFDTSVFVKRAKYKLPRDDKPGNIAVQKFIKRMVETRQRLERNGDLIMASKYKLPEVGDSFLYVVVEAPAEFDVRGCKIKNDSISDKMEFVEVYEHSQHGDRPFVIDFNYYMDSAVFGLFARFISYMKEFEPPDIQNYDLDDKDDYKKYDTYLIKEAKKFITKYCQSIIAPSSVQPAVAPATRYKRLYKHVTRCVHLRAVERHGSISAHLLFNANFMEQPGTDRIFASEFDRFEQQGLYIIYGLSKLVPMIKTKCIPKDLNNLQTIVDRYKIETFNAEREFCSLLRISWEQIKEVRAGVERFIIYMRRVVEYNDEQFDRDMDDITNIPLSLLPFITIASRLAALYSLQQQYGDALKRCIGITK